MDLTVFSKFGFSQIFGLKEKLILFLGMLYSPDDSQTRFEGGSTDPDHLYLQYFLLKRF